MTLMTPDEYACYQALNAWTGRGDLARLKADFETSGAPWTPGR